MMNRLSLPALARWTAALLLVSAILFALVTLMESTGEESLAVGRHAEAGEVNAANEAEAHEGTSHGEGSHLETAEANEDVEKILGVDLESPWLVWGFVGVSLLLVAGVLRLWRPAFAMTVLVAGAATFLDVREVFYQFGRGNTLLASLALLVALFHAVATIMAALGWQSLGPVPPPPIAA